ncbi:MAG: hypothetical protein JXR72_03165 [Proteobacteria bacterium]|nr:hypothetical protein [Pseudomonadota bacterium]
MGKKKVFGMVETGYYLLLSAALFLASIYLVSEAFRNLWLIAREISGPVNIPLLLESIILVTLSIAVFDLGKAFMEEELVRGTDYLKHSDVRRGLTRFLTAVTIAASIEVLMLIFKFSLEGPENLKYAALLLVGIALLIGSLGLYSLLCVKAETRKDRME